MNLYWKRNCYELNCEPWKLICWRPNHRDLITWISVQFSCSLCPALYDPMNCSMPGLPVHHQLPEFTETHVHWVSDAIQPSHPLSSHLLLPSIFPSIRVFSNESVLWMRWPKYWSFSFSISPSNENSGLISFRMDCLFLTYNPPAHPHRPRLPLPTHRVTLCNWMDETTHIQLSWLFLSRSLILYPYFFYTKGEKSYPFLRRNSWASLVAQW